MPDTIGELVRVRAADAGAKPMVIDPDTRLTYAELDTTTRELAAAFIAAGVTKGTRVGLIMPNCARWVQIAVALTRIGAVLVPLSTLLQAPELVAQLRVASVQILVTVEEFRGHHYLDDVQPELTKLPALREVWTPDHLTPVAATGIVDAVGQTVTPSDTLAVMFTSGSSGPPKGVIHSHGNALGAVRSGLAARCIDSDTRLYLPMPFFWVGGFGSGVLSALLAGATLVTEEIPRPETTLAAAGARTGDAVSRLARSGRGSGTAIRFRRSRFVVAAAGKSGGAATGRATRRTRRTSEAVRDDGIVRALLRLSGRHRHAAIGVGQLW